VRLANAVARVVPGVPRPPTLRRALDAAPPPSVGVTITVDSAPVGSAPAVVVVSRSNHVDRARNLSRLRGRLKTRHHHRQHRVARSRRSRSLASFDRTHMISHSNPSGARAAATTPTISRVASWRRSVRLVRSMCPARAYVVWL